MGGAASPSQGSLMPQEPTYQSGGNEIKQGRHPERGQRYPLRAQPYLRVWGAWGLQQRNMSPAVAPELEGTGALRVGGGLGWG